MNSLKHVVEAQQFNRELLEHIFYLTDRMSEHSIDDELEGQLMACLFYEPSTRTRFSFEAAMNRLGGKVLVTDKAGEFSSAAKGETLEDTIRVMSGYVDVIVLRHHEEGAAVRAASVSDVPIINAGDGAGQHPTQSLLDLYTIADRFGTVDEKHVAIVGDLKYGRTARSLAYLLTKFDDVELTFVAPPQLRMGRDLVDYCIEKGVKVHESSDMKSVLPNVDCVYMTRIQQERMSASEYEETKGKFILTPRLVDSMHGNAIILHPLPRVDEIPPSVDNNHRARYFEQAKNGLYVRMALLYDLLGT